jgi:hypothetical protein
MPASGGTEAPSCESLQASAERDGTLLESCPCCCDEAGQDARLRHFPIQVPFHFEQFDRHKWLFAAVRSTLIVTTESNDWVPCPTTLVSKLSVRRTALTRPSAKTGLSLLPDHGSVGSWATAAFAPCGTRGWCNDRLSSRWQHLLDGT